MSRFLRIAFILLPIIFILISSGSALAWNGISHYHINLNTGVDSSVTFGVNGTGPDMSVQWIGDYPAVFDENGNKQQWPDYFHSPDPKFEDGKRPFADKPNFAYLMLKLSGKNGILSDKERAQALGWGGHIAADWVAHNDNLFPICPDGSSGSVKHFMGECLCEAYSFLTKGPTSATGNLSITFDDKQIYKALYNYRLISIHEAHVSRNEKVSDFELKNKALQTNLPRSFIRERIKRWAAKLAVIQFAYAKSVGSWDPISRTLFAKAMEEKGVASNLALSEMSVYSWVNNPTPRGSIPDYSRQVVPFYKENLMNMSQPASSRLISAASGSALKTAQSLSYSPQMASTLTVEAEDAALWQQIVDTSLENEKLEIEETETSEGLYQVSVIVRDEEGLWDCTQESVRGAVSSPTESLGVSSFWKRLLVDGVSDPDELIDVSPPVVTPVSPVDGSFINTATPEIKAEIRDDFSGLDENLSGASITVDGIPISYSAEANTITSRAPFRLKDGPHRIRITVSDRAGNKAQQEWCFNVDTKPPRACYKVKNRIINSTKPQVNVMVLANEPVNYNVMLNPVIDGMADLNNVTFQKKYPQQKIVSWEGIDDQGLRAPAGQYLMRIQVIDRAGNMRTISAYIMIENY